MMSEKEEKSASAFHKECGRLSAEALISKVGENIQPGRKGEKPHYRGAK